MRATLDFLLHRWLKVETLCERPRFADHNAETFGAVLDTAEKIAKEKFAPFNRLVGTVAACRSGFAARRVGIRRAHQAIMVAASSPALAPRVRNPVQK